ncbi:hypothetical protein I0P70_12415 [Pontibacter sp. FD36]|uniref:hypothetical protein n=1 Tax=Pontibacter sp. FD36 TaxID=2789860 RepID=UPI0018AAB2B9|nr:hypothetical protein [Pontibacter sp. FD36]MBF8964051.1 hypothetical protein [Pontibacter sp. FD36]
MSLIKLPAIVKLKSSEPYDEAALKLKYEKYIFNKGDALDLNAFQNFIDYISANEEPDGKLTKGLIRVGWNRIIVSIKSSIELNSNSALDENHLPYSATLVQYSIDYLVIDNPRGSEYLVTEGWNLSKYQGGENVDAYLVDINGTEVVEYRPI